jgi:hypothetical protein
VNTKFSCVGVCCEAQRYATSQKTYCQRFHEPEDIETALPRLHF